jgi:uncharacterized Ntn-hydrolase superfamily protein
MTYSIVARDPHTGELGVAVQSHWFSVGPIVPWAQPGVGAVATQANAEISYGPKALQLLAEGLDAHAALEQLVNEDPGAAGRQVAVVDAHGRVAAHTGDSAIPCAGHETGEGYSCQANIMVNHSVWPGMAAAFESSTGRLAERLLDTLDAAEDAGGDARGRQSAALLVVPADGEPWRQLVSLRVEDHLEPLAELRRLLTLHDAYELADAADGLVNDGKHADAAELYRRASALAPGNHELLFWAGLGTAQAGDVDAGVEQVKRAIDLHAGWAELLDVLPAEVAPSAAIVRDRLP